MSGGFEPGVAEFESFTIPGAARGFAIVEFTEIKTAKSALKLNGTSLGGNKLVASRSQRLLVPTVWFSADVLSMIRQVKKYERSRADEKQMQRQAATKQQQLEKEKAKREHLRLVFVRLVGARAARAATRCDDRFRVVVKGFPKSTTRAELEEHFGSCGEIRTIALPQKAAVLQSV